MKSKGITIWEQHLEHLVLGVAALIFLGFAAMQFIGDPNVVEVPGKGKIGPGQIDALLEQQATEISQRMVGQAIEVPPPAPVLGKFNDAKSAPISPQATLVSWAPNLHPGGEFLPPVGEGLFVTVTVPPPFELSAKQYDDTLVEEVLTDYPDLQKLLPSAPPYDVRWTTLFAKFDAAALLKQYSQPGPNREAPLLQKWYNRRIDFIDLKLMRRELVDGQWTEPMLLSPIPGQTSVRAQLTTRIDIAERDRILALVAEPAARDGIIQPEFYECMAGAWSPPTGTPDAAKPGADVDPIIAALKSKLEKHKAERERIAKKLKDGNCPESEPEPPPRKPKPGGKPPAGGTQAPGGGLGTGEGSGGRSIKDPNAKGNKSSETECKRLRNALRKLNEQIKGVEDQLAKLAPKEPEQPTASDKPKDEPLPDEIMVWAHDLTIQPGHTYQYAFVMEVYNPLFAHKLELVPAQQPLAEKFTLASAVSEWSAPFTAAPPLRLFITDARATAQASGPAGAASGTATAEVFRFLNGRWWREKFPIHPGDRIGGLKLPRAGDAKDGNPPPAIDFGTDWFLLDVVEDVAASDMDVKSGLGAMVVLQSLSTGALTQVRMPRDEAADPQLQFLRQEVQSAEVRGAVASSG